MKKFTLKKFTSILLASAMIMSVTGCSKTDSQPSPSSNNKTETSAASGAKTSDTAAKATDVLDPSKPVTVKLYSYSMAYPNFKPGIDELIKTFNDTVGKEKGVIVEGVVDPSGSKSKADIQAGQEVDMIQELWGNLDTAKTQLGAEAYEDVFPADQWAAQTKGMEKNALDLGKIDGKTYGLAFTLSTPVMFINSKIFKDAGLDPKNPPKTWKEVLDYSKTIKEKTGKTGIGLPPQWGWMTQGLIYSNGGEMLSPDRKKALFASDSAVEAMTMYQSLYKNKVAALGTDSEVSQQFSAGEVGMILYSSAALTGYLKASKDSGWDLVGAPMPQFEGKTAVPSNSGGAIVVRTGKDPKKTAAIWEFVKFATGDQGFTIITSKIGYLPIRTYLADDPKFLKGYVDANPIVKINISQLKNVKGVAIFPGDIATQANQIFDDATIKAVTTDGDVKSILTKAQDDITKLLEGSN